jgi:hypothetical protein
MRSLQWMIFGVCLPSFFVASVLGQTEPPGRAAMSTDRPSFTTDSGMMAPGEYQLEMGYTYYDLEIGDASTAPEMLFRYGFDDKWEFRLGWDGYTFGDDDVDIAGGTDLGFKYHFKEAGEEFFIPGMDFLNDVSMALIATFTLPTGHDHNDFDTQTLLGWNYDLDDKSSLAGNIGFGLPTDLETGDRFAQGVFSVMYSRVINDQMSAFGEYYTNFPAADDKDCEHIIQGGVLYAIDDDMQVDFRAGFGLNDQSPDWLVGVGFSYRF